MAYIKKINGYLVKDEEARQKISTLEESVSLLREDLDSTDASLETAKDAIEQLQSDYQDTREALNDVAHRADDAYELADSANTAAGNAQQRADQAYALAEGRNSAHVFDDEASMKSALKGASKTEYGVGDHLLIRATDEPDYWISNVLQTNEGEYGYYEVSILETEKVDLSGYVTSDSLTTTLSSYAKTNGTYSSMTVGSANSAGKVANKLTFKVGGISLTDVQYDGSSAVTIGSESYRIANAVNATNATNANKATGDEDGLNIKNYYALKTYADAYNITFSVTNEELTILKNNQKPFVAPTA